MNKITLTLCVLIAVISTSAQATFVPHGAVYGIKLKKTNRAADVQSIEGTLAYSLQDQCDVWIIESDMEMFIAWANVSRTSRRTMLLTEAKDDSVGSFVLTNVEQMRDGRRGTRPVREVVEGRLELPEGEPARLTVKGTDGVSEMPQGTLLTTRHLMEMVAAAQSDRRFVSHTVLDPSLEQQVARVTGFVLGPAEDARLENLGQAWSMRLAYFVLDQVDAEPDYELEIVVSDMGVVSSFIQYIDGLEVAGELQSLEVGTPLDCN